MPQINLRKDISIIALKKDIVMTIQLLILLVFVSLPPDNLGLIGVSRHLYCLGEMIKALIDDCGE